jgi:hypothetical protein
MTNGLSTAAVESVCHTLAVTHNYNRLHRASNSETTIDGNLMLVASPEDRERLSSSDDDSGDDCVETVGPDDVDEHCGVRVSHHHDKSVVGLTVPASSPGEVEIIGTGPEVLRQVQQL